MQMPNQNSLKKLDALLARGETEMFYTVELVTPEMAARLLENNPDNRKLRERGAQSVAAFADAIKIGEWKVNGQDIIVSHGGELNDGQHRLTAVVKAGKPVLMGMKFGVERETRDTLDQGTKRTPADVLRMRGEKSANTLAAAASFLHQYKRGSTSFKNRPRTSEIVAIIDKNPGLRDAIRRSSRIIHEYTLSGATISAAVFLCDEVCEETTDRLIRAAVFGVGIDHDRHPAVDLRKRYLDHASGRNRMEYHVQAAFFIKAFNSLRRGKSIRRLVWRDGEQFPRPK